MSRTRRDRNLASSPTPIIPFQGAILPFSSHAARRAARRNVRRDGVAYVLTYGRLCYRTGARFFFLGARDVPFEDRRDPWVTRLVGTVVVVASTGEIITTYRNRHAFHHIARKMKYRLFDEPWYREASSFDKPAPVDAIA